MTERRRPPRRGRGPRTTRPAAEQGEPNPYRDGPSDSGDAEIERAPQASELAAPAAPASPPPPPITTRMESTGNPETAAPPLAASAAALPAPAPTPRMDNGSYA